MSTEQAEWERAIYDAGKEDVFAGAPIHDFDHAVSSEDRTHDLTADCWCQPSVETVPATRVTHHFPEVI